MNISINTMKLPLTVPSKAALIISAGLKYYNVTGNSKCERIKSAFLISAHESLVSMYQCDIWIIYHSDIFVKNILNSRSSKRPAAVYLNSVSHSTHLLVHSRYHRSCKNLHYSSHIDNSVSDHNRERISFLVIMHTQNDGQRQE